MYLWIERVELEGSWSELNSDGQGRIWLEETEKSKASNLSRGSLVFGQPFDHLDFLLLYVSECWVGRPSGKLSYHRMSYQYRVIFHQFQILSQLVIHLKASYPRPWTLCRRRISFLLFCYQISWPFYAHTQIHFYANYTRDRDIH